MARYESRTNEPDQKEGQGTPANASSCVNAPPQNCARIKERDSQEPLAATLPRVQRSALSGGVVLGGLLVQRLSDGGDEVFDGDSLAEYVGHSIQFGSLGEIWRGVGGMDDDRESRFGQSAAHPLQQAEAVPKPVDANPVDEGKI